MLILFIGDGHITGRNPVARTDDLVTLQFKKWEEIITIANHYQCPIITSGDIFNVAIIANSLLNQFGMILNKLDHPMYFVWGNHDLMYHNLEMWDRTSMGVCWTNNKKLKHISEFYIDYKIPWDYRDWDCPINKNKSPFLLTHKAVITTQQVGKNSWILEDKVFADAIENTPELHNYKLILCGHWHKQYILTYNKIKIINAGPIIRRTVDELQQPQVLLIDLNNLLIKKIVLKTAPPTEEVISSNHIDAKMDIIKQDIIQFVNQLNKTNTQKGKIQNVLEILMTMLDNHELDKDVEILLREIIESAMLKHREEIQF
jgi:DNA repair exonuclease SbcCD nuclease subunit